MTSSSRDFSSLLGITWVSGKLEQPYDSYGGQLRIRTQNIVWKCRLVWLSVLWVWPCAPQAPLPSTARTAAVEVRAVNGFGDPLAGPRVNSFVDSKGRDWVAIFRGGARARGVPFGTYRISLSADASYRDANFEAEINASDVVITEGLEWGGVENIRPIGMLSGRLEGFPAGLHEWRCHADGLYQRVRFESPVRRDSNVFDFGEVPPGIYVLVCVADRKLTVLRTVQISANSAPITVEYKPGVDHELP